MSMLKNIRVKYNKEEQDIGLDRKFQQGRQRTLNKDGTYNIQRITGNLLGNFRLYHWLINTSWSRYWLTVFLFYGGMNLLFASLYFVIGTEGISGIGDGDSLSQFLLCFFFSAQSFTTVGYGGLHPTGLVDNFVASIEAFIGLMSFALATGTLYGRFSRPVAAIKYSKNAIIAPFENGRALQFMIGNKVNSNLLEMETSVNMAYNAEVNGNTKRMFVPLKLQISKIMMFPLSWTLNHVIDDESPFANKDAKDILKMEIEIYILIRGFDESFAQTIYSKHSFTGNELVWGAKFVSPMSIADNGLTILDLTKIGLYEPAIIPAATAELESDH